MGAVFSLAVGLRLLHAGVRWHEDAWRYSIYPAETLHRIAAGDFLRLPLPFTGLHPPAWPVLHSLMELASPRPVWWLLSGVALSVGAVMLVARRSVWAGLWLAASPVAVHYCAEVNQYPLLIFAIAGVWTTPSASRGPVAWNRVAWGVLAAWTHALGGVAAVLALTDLPKGQRAGTGVVFALGCLPLVPSVLLAWNDSGTFAQPPFVLTLVLEDLVGRFGGLGLLAVGVALLQVPRHPRLGVGLIGGGGVLAAFVGLGVAAPHQFPYLLTLVPLVALLAGAAPRAARWVVPLVVVQTLWMVGFDSLRVRHIVQDLSTADRGIDHALAQLQHPWTCPDTRLDPTCSGDALVLVRSPGRNDDDKTRYSPVLWRIAPWNTAPRVVLPQQPLHSSDHRHGQPRLVSLPSGPFAVYIHDQVRTTMSDLHQNHARVWVVVSDVGTSSSLGADVADTLGQTGVAVGPDVVFGP